ncbi:hypothetical protein NUM3379_39570 [Kineococcus sp. NUM-3379]
MQTMKSRRRAKLATAAAGALLLAPFGAAAPAQAAPAGSPAVVNGQVRVCGVKLCNQHGNPIQLRGMSTHGIQWFDRCYNDASLDVLANEWRSDLLRIAMYVQEGGYETNPTGFTNRVNQLVDEAEERGMYAMIDFHTLTPGDPLYNLDRAKTFFDAVSRRNAAKTNVIYEITNEPNRVSWANVRSYAEQVIPVIRRNDPDAVIIVGTPGWSSLGVSDGSDHTVITNNPVRAENIMYAFHYYSSSHKDNYRAEVERASRVLPLFVTEFGNVAADGGGAVDRASSVAWLDLLDRLGIGYANWTYSDAAEGSAAFRSGTCTNGGYAGTTNLTESGALVRSRIMTPDNFPTGTGGGGGDTQAPTAPSAVRSTGTTSSSVSLAWTASSDAVGVTGYDVYRGTTRVGTATGTSFTDTGLAASTAYSYTVRARDAAGNVSAASAPVSVTTGAGTTPPPPPPGGVKVQYRNTGTSATDNQANLAVQLVNTGTTTRNLTGTSLRYYFTRDGGTSFTVACDWAQIGCANLQNRVVPLATPVAGADAYVETTFTAGSVAAGASTGEIQLRFHRNDWQNLNETNDHSRGTNTAPADSTRITAHSGGTLLWGTPPA